MPAGRRGPALVLLAVIPAAGCAGSVQVKPAEHARDPQCSQVIVSVTRTPQMAGLNRREVTAQAAAAWGDPAVVLRCGVPVPGPSTEGCVRIDGVDWLGPRDPQNNDRRYVTYGRTPAVEVFVPLGSPAAIESILGAVNPAVERLPQSRTCN